MKGKYLLSCCFVLFCCDLPAQSCRSQIEALKAELTIMVLLDKDLIEGNSCSSFVGPKSIALGRIQTLLECKEITDLHFDLRKLYDALLSVKISEDGKSLGKSTRVGYYSFVAAREFFGHAVVRFEISLLTNKLKIDIKEIVDDTENRVKDMIRPLSSIPNDVNKRTKHLVDSLGDTLKVRTDTLKRKIDSLDHHLDAVDKKLSSVNDQFRIGTLYTGINWFTQNGLGFSMHYHILIKNRLSALTGLSLLYQTQTQNQSVPESEFGFAINGGFSWRFSNSYRVGLLADLVLMNGNTNLGGRIMAYNHQLAVGMGYSEFMGADITLMIKFYDPRAK